MALGEGHELALSQLEAMAASGDAFELLEVVEPEDADGNLLVRLSLRCAGFEQRPGGLTLRARERFRLSIPAGFPFDTPSVDVAHRRWAGTPHVQWATHLCLYQAPATEWHPADGMFGFVARLRYWLEKGALGELDPVGGALHPPAVYRRSSSLPMIIPRADTPPIGERPWLGLAELHEVSPRRVDIVDWTDILDQAWPPRAAIAVLLPQALTWEYPTRIKGLLDEFTRQGVDRKLFLSLLRLGSFAAEEGGPLYIVVGSPMRRTADGEPRQHLEVWHLGADFASGVRATIARPTDNEEIRELRADLEAALLALADVTPIDFCYVREDRAEVTERRDAGSSLEVFRGKTVSIWGCGALGGWVADMLARAGVARLILYDNAIVTPGILVRQPYTDADLGYAKAQRLHERLIAVRPEGLDVDVRVSDVMASALASDDWSDGSDIVIDATAAGAVATKLERMRRLQPRPVTVVSMLVGHRAERGLLAIARPTASGGPADVVRRVKLACAARAELKGFLDEFWPEPPRQDVFQPEPGCSDATFRGSGAEVVALAATMLVASARELAAPDPPGATAWLTTLPGAEHEGQREVRLAWPADIVVRDGLGDYEIRISQPALAEIRAWSRRTARLLGPRVETGGLIFGERDDAAGVVWVSEVTGPPSDSVESEEQFICGVAGNDEYAREKKERAGGSLAFIGMWHTHPGGSAMPSARDLHSMTALVLADDPPLPKSLALILGGTPDEPDLGAYVFDRSQYEAPFNLLVIHDRRVRPGRPQQQPRNVGLALSGGGSRAVAFHLGCMRALNDRGVLDRVQVTSCVSGGAVMGAAWAYSNDDFADLDARIVELLRRGLTRGMVRRTLAGRAGAASLATSLSSGVAALAARGANLLVKTATHLPFVPRRYAAALRFEPPLRRYASRTEALRDTLKATLFGERLLTAPRRGEVDVVVNACELRSGAAFRFGSRESSCSRYGIVDGNQIEVAEAVAASAAYPLLLPALDRSWRFRRRNGTTYEQRIVLTDGGVYDNLATTCLEPGRSPDHTYNIFPVDFVVACDAGRGTWATDPVPYFWISRMRRSFESVFRKAQDAGRGRLHELAANGSLQGFVMPYLGNRDDVLPVRLPNLVAREDVIDYPTDFSAMSQSDIDRLALRGEQLTRLFIDRWCPEL